MPSIPWWRAIGVVVQNPQQEDRMHNHEKPVTRQRKLHFEDDELWIIFPEEVRERCSAELMSTCGNPRRIK